LILNLNWHSSYGDISPLPMFCLELIYFMNNRDYPALQEENSDLLVFCIDWVLSLTLW